MAFDGSYRRQVREAGVAHRSFVRRARCSACGLGESICPDFVLRRRLDSADAVGAALLARAGVEVGQRAAALYAGVPERTVRSWRQRFAARAEELWQRLGSVSVGWGGDVPRAAVGAGVRVHAVAAIATVWRAAQRRPGADTPAAWRLANVIVGGQLISTRVNLPWPIRPELIGCSRGP